MPVRLSHPPATFNQLLTLIDVELLSGKAYEFHKHRSQ